MASRRPSARLLNVVRTLSATAARLKTHRVPSDAALPQLEASVQRSRCAVLVTDRNSRFVAANPAALRLIGYTRQELLTKGIWDVTPARDERDLVRLWRGFLETGEQYGDFELRGKSGRVVTTQYLAKTNLLPGVHVSVLSAALRPKRRAATARTKIRRSGVRPRSP